MKLYQEAFKAMGTPCEIQLYAKTKVQAQRAAKLIIADVRRLEDRYSRYRTDSFLSEINRVAMVGGRISVDKETEGLLNYAATCYRQSKGLFDITSGILRRAWNFKSGVLPSKVQVQKLLDKIGWEKLRWVPPVLEFSIAGMEIDFGGVVKEYAADRAASLSLQAGVRRGLVNLGGDIKVIGPRPGGEPWRIGIRHPGHKEAAMGMLLLNEGAIASSGDYERCIVLDGVRYGHVLNPRTGWPVRHLASVTVISDLCVVAGSASTIAMLKEANGPAWLQHLGLPHFWVDMEGETGGSLEKGFIEATAMVQNSERQAAITVLNEH
ncbi:FAD:protein FMN transferase [Nitrosococcus watsonii]|uniref:FAD:protein FMN transferase n=1 Tax=Nitrosococcus watsoni (strain C-113) TaxID=105559 RepID=D8K570_NITWC|nr:FAD:protein FMN transferase [Nitrosococcus watsonii]ADJ28047.1 ApbE family lipoprotein [Nitrosococcus watsonii C-113]